MTIPLALSPSTRTPGLGLTVDLLSGAVGPGSQRLKCLIMAPKATTGTLTADTEVRLLASDSEASTAYGVGSPGHLAWKQAFAENPEGVYYGIAPTASAGNAAAGSLTFTSTPSVAQNIRVCIAGRVINVPWLASETAADAATAVISYIGLATADCPITATTGGSGVVTLTSKVPGPWGNDCIVSCVLEGGTGGSVAVVTPTSGTTEPVFTTALSTISRTEYDFIIACLSNTDASLASAGNVAKLKTHINTYNTGRNSKLQRCVIGFTNASATAKTGTVPNNDPTFQFIHCISALSLPCELAGAECGSRMKAISLDPAANRIGHRLLGIYGAADLVTSTPSDATIEDEQWYGLSIISYNASGECVVVNPITGHCQTSTGEPDDRCLYTSEIDGAYAVAKDLRSAIPTEFDGAKLSPDQTAEEADADPLPAGVITPTDVKTFLLARLGYWKRRGVVRGDKLAESVANGKLVVAVDATNDAQLDVVLPLAIFKPLAKFSLYLNKTS